MSAERFPTETDEEREAALDAASRAVRLGRLVVLPTDTVYGVGADAFDPDAVARLLAAKGVDFEEYDITLGGPKRGEMLQRANGRTTVPQIFIDDVHVGGCDDLHALDRDGKLDPMLAG